MNDKQQQLNKESHNSPDNRQLTTKIDSLSTTARERLWAQISASFDASVTAPHWRCRASGTFYRLWAQMCDCARGKVHDLADLFQRLPKQWRDKEEVQRLLSIYHDKLCPVVRKHFAEAHQQVLLRSLKHLILLRLFDVPYRSGDPIAANPDTVELLHELYKQCQGHGLMRWQENGVAFFIVETEHTLYVQWVVRRIKACVQHEDRDKAISDALWATLFSSPDSSGGMTRCLLTAGDFSRTLCISREHFPNREGVTVTVARTKTHALVFESPWEMDRGRRVQQALRRLPNGLTTERVWIWEPRAFTQPESQIVLHYIATGHALRYAMREHTQGRGVSWIIDALRRAYMSTCSIALKTVLACFEEGLVISDDGVYTPILGEARLTPTLRALANWIQPQDTEVCPLYYLPENPPPYPDILPLSTGHDSTRSLNAVMELPQKTPIL